jgi:hypothetical protein
MWFLACFSETGSHYVAWTGLELWILLLLPLSAGTIAVCHHTQPSNRFMLVTPKFIV